MADGNGTDDKFEDVIKAVREEGQAGRELTAELNGKMDKLIAIMTRVVNGM